jgi:hypothetical protein
VFLPGPPWRRQRVTVEELIKNQSSLILESVITVIEPGGIVRRGATEYRTTYLRDPLHVGERVVFFLEPIPTGAEAAFEVRIAAGADLRSSESTEAIAPRSTLRRLDELERRENLTIGEVTALLRSFR